MRIILLMLAICLCPCLSANEPKYKLSVCTIFKNEAGYLKEWIEYHRLVGVDHFYLYDNDSTDQTPQVLAPYIEQGIVTLTQWPDGPMDGRPYSWVYNTQVPAFQNAIKISQDETQWLALIDSDEFLVPGFQYEKMTQVLDKYPDAPGVTLTWLIFGTSGVERLGESTLLIEALTRCGLEECELAKSIIKPALFAGFVCPPHRCTFKNNAASVGITKADGQINHYINRTVDFFLNQKIKSREKLQNSKLSQADIEREKNTCNDREDDRGLIRRFIPALRKQMGFTPNPENKLAA